MRRTLRIALIVPMFLIVLEASAHEIGTTQVHVTFRKNHTYAVEVMTAPLGLLRKLEAKAGQARSCYEHALRQNNLLQGRMSISMKINQSGQVCSSSVKSELGDPGVANCVLQIFKSASLPAPSKGCVDAVVPLNFQPKI